MEPDLAQLFAQRAQRRKRQAKPDAITERRRRTAALGRPLRCSQDETSTGLGSRPEWVRELHFPHQGAAPAPGWPGPPGREISRLNRPIRPGYTATQPR